MTDIERVIEEAWPKSALAEVLPFNSWERLTGETSAAFAAFCVFRDLGFERTIRLAVENYEKDKAKQKGKYNVWRNWAAEYRWRERTADYDRYIENLKLGEVRKTIEAQGEMHRKVTGKILEVVSKKLDLMDPAELTQGNVTEWAGMAIKAEREAAGLVVNGKPEVKQGELNFTPDFQGL